MCLYKLYDHLSCFYPPLLGVNFTYSIIKDRWCVGQYNDLNSDVIKTIKKWNACLSPLSEHMFKKTFGDEITQKEFICKNMSNHLNSSVIRCSVLACTGEPRH